MAQTDDASMVEDVVLFRHFWNDDETAKLAKGELTRRLAAGRHLRYGAWHIAFSPPPIPVRNCDYQYWHDDYDGAPDACDDRYGHTGSLADAITEIDDYEDEHADG